jgi:phage anti-repressor protein
MEVAMKESNSELNAVKKLFLECESKLKGKRDQLTVTKAVAASEFES